uniref:Thyroglobulin type-1 domain-containing protein n=1 Tax=Anopheles atroparvus TaxID=41427 RepID=A0A182J7Q3_ANOAO
MIRLLNGLLLCVLSWALLAGAQIELAKKYVCTDYFCDMSNAHLHPTGGYQYCADKDGALIESFEAPVNVRLAATCKCARARKLLLDSKSVKVPECCPNGNYKSLACRHGECYYVDEDGAQVGIERPEKDKQNLPCYDGGDYCPLAG